MRNDVKVKAILKREGVQLEQARKGKLSNHVKVQGVSVFQHCGIVIVTLNGFMTKESFQELVAPLNITDIEVYA